MNNIVYAGSDRQHIESYRHARKYWQIIICRGDGEITYGKGKTDYSDGKIAIIPPLTPYEKSDSGEEINIFMDWTALPFKIPSTVKDDENGGIAHAAMQAEYYFGEGSDAILNALGDLLASYIIEQNESTGYSPVVELVKSDINANISNTSYALDAFMHNLPLSYDYVRKMFKNEIGVTPHDYLVTKRMNLAAMLIKSRMNNAYSRYSVAQIAEMCGYAEPLYFSRVFKKFYGLSPSEYEKRN